MENPMQPNTSDMTPLQQKILDLLEKNPKGISRTDLQTEIFERKTSNYDRAIRRAISNLRDRGFVITSASDHAGYNLTTDPEAVRHYLNESVKRAKRIMRTARKVREAYGLRNQISMSLSS